MNALKEELKQNHSCEPKRGDDGWLSKEFLLQMHTILYSYKKYAIEIFSEANFRERIVTLREKKSAIEQGNQELAKEWNTKYDNIMKGEKGEIEKFNLQL